MNIYIGNLNYRVRESDLQQVLEEYGTVESVKLIIDRDTRRSKGFAFAELPNENEARNAIEELNGAEYEGRQMVVKEATETLINNSIKVYERGYGQDSVSPFFVYSFLIVTFVLKFVIDEKSFKYFLFAH